MKHTFLIGFILCISLLLRLGLLFVDYSWDVNNHISWAEDLINKGFTESFFTTISTHVFGSKYPNYPPLSLYLFYFLYPLQAIVHTIVWWLNTTIPAFPSNLIFFIETKTFLAGIFKLPAVFADFGVSYLLYIFGRKLTKEKKIIIFYWVSLLYLLNPVVFYNSAFWGQIDSIPLLFALAALYLALYLKHPVLAAILLVISILIKPNTIIYVPFFAYVYLKKFSGREIGIASIAALVFFYIAYIPFNSASFSIVKPFSLYWNTILNGQSMSLISNGAFNFWTLILPKADLQDYTKIIGILSYRSAGYLFFLLNIIITYFVVKRIKKFDVQVIAGLFFVAFAVFLFLTKMHERYVILFLPFLILMNLQNRKLLPFVVGISLLGFLNMYNSWPVPHFDFLNEALHNHFMYRTISACYIILFIVLLWKTFKYNSSSGARVKSE